MPVYGKANTRSPSINRAHPVGKYLTSAFVPAGSVGMVDIVHHQNGTRGTTPLATTFQPFLGQCAQFAASANNILTFSGYSTAIQVNVTVAAIVQVNTAGVQYRIFGASSGGWGLLVGSGNQIGLAANSVTLQTFTNIGITAANVPYFLAASYYGTGTSGGMHGVVRRLDTGALSSETKSVAIAAQANAPGTRTVGQSAANPFNGYIAGAFYSERFHHVGELRQWANDPWAIFQRPSNWAGYSSAGAGGGSLPPGMQLFPYITR